MKRTRSEKSGTARMTELGYKPIQIWLSPMLAKMLDRAARMNDQPKARYVLEALSARLVADKVRHDH